MFQGKGLDTGEEMALKLEHQLADFDLVRGGEEIREFPRRTWVLRIVLIGRVRRLQCDVLRTAQTQSRRPVYVLRLPILHPNVYYDYRSASFQIRRFIFERHLSSRR